MKPAVRMRSACGNLSTFLSATVVRHQRMPNGAKAESKCEEGAAVKPRPHSRSVRDPSITTCANLRGSNARVLSSPSADRASCHRSTLHIGPAPLDLGTFTNLAVIPRAYRNIALDQTNS